MSGASTLVSPSTDVQQVPSGWSMEKLAALVNIVYGKSPAEIQRLGEGIPIFGTGGVVGYTCQALFDGPSIILGRKGTIDKVQRCAGPFWAIDTTYYTTPKREFDWTWLYYAISSFDLRKLNEASGVPSLSRSSLEALDVAIPPLPEQLKIAAVLTAVDDKLDVTGRQIEATQTFKQGLMQTLFSRGVGTQDANGRWVPHTDFKESGLGEIPATWVPTTLGAVCDGALQTGPFGSQLHAHEYQDEGVPVLMPKDLVGCRATLSTAAHISLARAEDLSKHKVLVGDLLFSRRGDVARFALIDDKSEGALCGTGCLKARPSAAHSSAFLAQLLQLDVVRAWMEQNAVGQTMPNMNTSILSSLPLVVPVDRREQDEIARILDSIDSKLQVLAVKLSHLRRLKRGLMQKLLKGEWRVSLGAIAT
ncbi:restriction endonuclease subunit S [Stenotrophomonas sp. NPDC077659]|uniref:restriction endonuclease subunit S n=1 Tax=Stenotrophomonas sp. NPDC077659 TaxID=3390694 RepID=UPI003CFC9BDC